MFASAWNFVKRHRRKMTVSAVVLGGGFVLGKILLRKMKQWEEKEVLECYEVLRKSQHFESTQKTCNQTVYSLSNNLRSAIESFLDADALINVLKAKPSNKLEVWEELKVLSLARPLTLAYTACVLVVFMKVQMNVLGGCLYVEATYPRGDALTQEMQQQYLTLVHRLFDDGMQRVVSALLPVVKSVVGPISLKTKLTMGKVEEMFQEIRREFESQHGHLISELMTPTTDEVALPKLLDETADVLNSEDCKAVFSSSLAASFTATVDALTGFFMDSSGSQYFVNPQFVEVPFAKLVPFLCNLIHVQCSSASGSLLHGLLRLETLNTFGANVYEAFCQADEKQT